MKDTESAHKTIVRNVIPCWYEISWQTNPPAIILRIHKDFVRDNTRIFEPNSPFIKNLKEKFDFKKFCGNLNENFGFDDTFTRQGKKNDFIEYLILLPLVKKEIGKCPKCHGEGKEKTSGYLERCLSCNGAGRKFSYDWQEAKAISASLSTVFTLLEFPEKETSAKTPQLITVRTLSMRGGPFSGEYSSFLRTYLSTLYQEQSTRLTEIIQTAMKTAYEFMFNAQRQVRQSDILVHIFSNSGWINIGCPGSACGLAPNCDDQDKTRKSGYGYRFASFNVDSAAQQLTLLAGLAALHDKARQEIKEY